MSVDIKNISNQVRDVSDGRLAPPGETVADVELTDHDRDQIEAGFLLAVDKAGRKRPVPTSTDDEEGK
jgi:hypothetical protein